MQFFSIFLLIACWIGYFVIHSLAASNVMKAWVRENMAGFHPFYRLSFNLSAVFLLLPPLAVLYLNKWPSLWQWPESLSWLQHTLGIAALLCFVMTFRMYSGMDFLGISQVIRPEPRDNPKFVISGFHRYVRHPWYCFALVLLWSRDMNEGLFITAVLATLYFIVGSKLEEKKLIEEFGKQYSDYSKKVPALFPIPGIYLSAEEAREITK